MRLQPRAGRAYAGWLMLLVTAAIAAVALRPAVAQEPLSDPVAFAESSYANNCAECHGQDGTGQVIPGTDERAPALVGRDVTPAYMDLVLRTGRMPPVGDPYDNRDRHVFYDEEERAAMVAWTTEAFDLEGDMPQVEEGDVARGLELFALNCAHCHGNAGSGGTAGQAAFTPAVNDLDPIAIAQAIRVGPFEMPAFSEAQLSQEDVDDIASYLEAVEAETGTPLFGLVELNPVYASGFVGLLAVVLLGALLFVGGRPTALESVPLLTTASALAAPRPSDEIGMTDDGRDETTAAEGAEGDDPQTEADPGEPDRDPDPDQEQA